MHFFQYLSWMAWTWQTAVFFILVFMSIAAIGVWNYFSPELAPRHGIFGLDTTRGDRLFMSLLGSAFIMLAWLGLISVLLGGGIIVCVIWAFFIFRYA